jgi:hypothetical protein
MKKTTLLFLCLILASCYSDDNQKNLENTSSWEIEEKEWIIENTTNIINEYYTETLPNTIKDAKDVVNNINDGYKNMQQEIDSLR